MKQNTVLLVDDESPVLNILELMLSRLGYNILTAQTGEEALLIFQTNQKDIKFIISDVNMEPIDGWQLLQSIRSLSLTVPFIMNSGYGRQENTDRYQYQPTSYLTKPYLLSKLTKTVLEIL